MRAQKQTIRRFLKTFQFQDDAETAIPIERYKHPQVYGMRRTIDHLDEPFLHL